MYTSDELQAFFYQLNLPSESIAPLLREYSALLHSDNAPEILASAEESLFAGASWSALLPKIKPLYHSGVHRYTVDFLFFAGATKKLRTAYAARSLPDALFWDMAADLKYKLLECHDIYGVWGTFVPEWYPRFYTLGRFAIGRMQYEALPCYLKEPVTIGGYTVSPNDIVYNMHIPSSGPMPRAIREDSYRRAYEFFKGELAGRPMVVFCDSWLLYPDNRKIYPPDSNTVDFLSDFHICSYKLQEDFYDMWRIFGKDYQKPLHDLPEDTSMRRALKQWLLQGHRAGTGIGIFLYDGEKHLR